jgi:hypothetical protein
MVEVIKKATVPSSILSELDWETGGYLIRYRIVSENKNIRSHWSPVYFMPAEDFLNVEGEISENVSDTDPTKTIVNVVWDDFFNRPSYDVFVAFRGNPPENTFEYDGDDFYYHGRSTTHNYAFINRPDVESIRIIVQPASNKQLIKDSFIIYDSDNPLVEVS